jgi:hypothetical protein
MIGLSSSVVEVHDSHAVKYCTTDDCATVRYQGMWLASQTCKSLPQVHTVTERAYTMERLYPPGDVTIFEALSALHEVHRLERTSNEARLDRAKLQDRLNENFSLVQDEPHLAHQIANEVRLYQQAVTHGDPTYENMMRREDRSLVLIDPLAPTPIAPSDIAVDIGKMMQSVSGWSQIVYPNEKHVQWTLMSFCYALPADVYSAAVTWIPVHLARTIRYVREDLRWEVLNLVKQFAYDL